MIKSVLIAATAIVLPFGALAAETPAAAKKCCCEKMKHDPEKASGCCADKAGKDDAKPSGHEGHDMPKPAPKT